MADRKETENLKYTGSWLNKDNILNEITYNMDSYKVVIGKIIKIYHNSILIMSINLFRGFWWGYDSTANLSHGNSILIKLNIGKYLYIGHEMYHFTTDDIITEYVSPVIDNTPRPVAFGKKYIYFMLDNMMIDREHIDTRISISSATSLYDEFYIASENKISMDATVICH